ncbi:MAG: hypothetical protein ABI430_03985 [Candidatus Taylorbacteria bacterium]
MRADLLNELLAELGTKYSRSEQETLRDFFLNWEFNGQIFAFRLLERAALVKPRWEFEKLMQLWRDRTPVWNGNPERIGDTDDVLDGNGGKIWKALWDIYIALGIAGKYKGLQ